MKITPAKRALALRLYDEEGFSVREVAAAIGCAYGGIYPHLRAHTTLRQRGGPGRRSTLPTGDSAG